MTFPEGWEWDEEKAERNLAAHGVGFEDATWLDLKGGVERTDDRFDYDGEVRLRAIAPLDGRLHVMVYTWRDGRRRVISLRKANLRERRWYERER